jgi:hypothetical protein
MKRNLPEVPRGSGGRPTRFHPVIRIGWLKGDRVGDLKLQGPDLLPRLDSNQ